MKIKKIEIDSFGKFKNFALDLSDGFNLILGNNEEGKTTLMSFLKMMFYGKGKGGGDLFLNTRARYTPWDGSKMSGSVTFERDGRTYYLQKEFKKTANSDKTAITDIETGEKILLNKDEEVGKRFLGLDLASFEKTVFIGNIGGFASAESGDLTAKLSNLVSSGDDLISQGTVLKRLSSAKEKMVTKRRDKGVLVEAQAELESLETDKRSVIILEEAQAVAKEEYNRLDALLKAKETQEKNVSCELEKQAKNKEFNVLNSLIDDMTASERLRGTVCQGEFDEKAVSDMINKWNELNAKALPYMLSANTKVKSENEIKVTSEEFKEFKAKSEEKEKLEYSVEIAEKFITPAKKQLEMAQKNCESKKNAKKPSIVFYIFGAILLVLSLVCGTFINPYIYGGTAISLALIAYGIYMGKQGKRIAGEVDELEDTVKVAMRNYEEQVKKLDDITESIAITEYATEKKKQLLTVQNEILAMLAQKKCKTEDEFSQKYDEYRYFEKKEEERINGVSALGEIKSEMIELVGKYKRCETFEEAEQSVRSAVEGLARLNTFKERISAVKRVNDISESFDALVKRRDELIDMGAAEIRPTDYTKETENVLRAEISTIQGKLMEISRELKTPERSIDTIDYEISEKQTEIEDMQKFYSAVCMAEEAMQESADEINRSFGPELNKRAAEIFEKLTDGRYKGVIVSKDFEIDVRPSESTGLYKWKYLSGGTADQAYLALRLALCELICEDGEKMPLLLDDIFMQYDDERAEKVIKFVSDFAKDIQVVMFTCHKHIAEILKKNINNVNVITLK